MMIYSKQDCQKLQEEISSLEKELSALPNDDFYPSIPLYKFRKRKQFRSDSKKALNLQKKLLELREKLAEINRDLSPEEFKILVREGKIILTEEDKKVLDVSSEFKSLDDLCLVHKCDYMPFNNEIKSALSSNGESIRSFKIGSKTYEYKHKEQRHTVHFAVNGEVGSHDAGNWDVRKYAVIVPFERLLNDMVSACSCDSFVRDRALLNEECYILCPKEEVEKVRRNNNSVNVIPYEGDNVSGFANAVISFLGYRYEKVSNHGWISDDQYLYDALMRKQGLSTSEHMSTEDYDYDSMKNSYTHVLEIYSRLFLPDIEIDLNLLESMQKDSYDDNVYRNLRFHISEIIKSSTSYYRKKFNTSFNRDRSILLLIKLLNDLKSFNPDFSFENDFDVLKSKYFGEYHDSIEPFINDVLNALFKGVIEKPKKKDADHNDELDYSEEGAKKLYH